MAIWQAADRAPIFLRSFVLTMAALLVAESTVLALLLASPPLHNAPVPLTLVARLLNPRSPAPGNVLHGPAQEQRPEMRAYDSPGPVPAQPADQDTETADEVRHALAADSGLAIDTLVVHVRRGHAIKPPPGVPASNWMLGEGFYVAHRMADGRLRVVESMLERFPNVFIRQVLVLLALGAGLLAPLAWLFARAIASPIRRFAAAAHQVGVDPNLPALPVRGPAEVRRAAEAFNAMQERIRRLLEERTEIIAAIAHDLRTPLARLSFRVAELSDAAQERAAADIDEMTTMISRTLDFCSGRALAQQRDPLDFRLLVESVVDDYADTGAPVQLEVSASVVVRGEAMALRRAIANLVDNALKYGGRARLAIEPQDDHVLLEVDDNGPGIPEALQAAALRPFTRIEASRGRETGGIGLGLTVVRATVLDHGGELRLANRPEGGLRVTVQLPCVTEFSDDPAPTGPH